MSTLNIPVIPESAPFSAEQRAWLNGLLAGLLSMPTAAVDGPAATALVPVSVFFATQSGTAERLAKKFAKELRAQGHTVTLSSLESVLPAALAEVSHAVFFASTYGEGEPPDPAKRFADALFSDAAPRLDSLRYSVFCLGDSNYEQFCKFGIDLHERLAQLGAQPLGPRSESDVEVDAPFQAWKTEIAARLRAGEDKPAASAAPGVAVASTRPAPSHTRDKPYAAELRERRPLTSASSTKLTMHLAFSLAGSELGYQAGDACGVVAQNDASLVAETLSLLNFAASSEVNVPKVGRCTLEDALLHHCQHTRLTRKVVQAFAGKAKSRTLSALLLPEQGAHLEAFLWDRGLIDMLQAYPGVVDSPQELIDTLPRLAPRLYSISSSPLAHKDELHCTVAVVRYRSHNRERGGVASTMLADRVEQGARVPIYIQANTRFRLPSDPDTPIIMIGPGTGIAPFRAFLHERQALGHRGRNWLFFGERSASTDFLYCHELRAMCDSGHLARLDTAFSRDQEHKVYVQDRMVEHGAEFWRWLQEGAQVYVCGDATRMAKDVDASLHTLVEQHGGVSREAAADYVLGLHEQGRYHRDVY